MSGYTMTATNAPLDEMNKGRWYGQITDIVRQPGNPNSEYGGGDQIVWKIEPHGYIYVDPNMPTPANPTPKGPDYFIKREIWAFMSMQFTPKAKARKWVQQILGRPLGEGEPFDLLSLKGTMVTFDIGRSNTDRAKVMDVTQYVQQAPVQYAPPAQPQQAPPQPTYEQTAPPPQQYPAPAQPQQAYVPPQAQQQQYQAPAQQQPPPPAGEPAPFVPPF